MDHIIQKARTSEELGLAVRSARTARGMRQDQLAELVGVSRMTISRMERGAEANMTTVMKALSECGYGIAVVPKFADLRIASDR
jgi:transcriptional regulator with XRE-family HTH domain